jgi:NAD(P)H-dependent FMN reductase
VSAGKLAVVVVSTREARVGPVIAEWFVARARAHAGFEVELVDLKTVALPLLDEPKHPRARDYQFDHTKRWSAIVDAAAAYAFVTPEYNYGVPPSLVNALDYLAREWAYKPVGFVSYGGVSGGTRSVQMAKQIITTLKMMPIPEAVTIPFFPQHVRDGAFHATEQFEQAAKTMLDELVRWSSALAVLRA